VAGAHDLAAADGDQRPRLAALGGLPIAAAATSTSSAVVAVVAVRLVVTVVAELLVVLDVALAVAQELEPTCAGDAPGRRRCPARGGWLAVVHEPAPSLVADRGGGGGG
jgi:hypothetical protein